MPSERRLHPWSLAFTIGARLRELALPFLALIVTAGSRGWGWEAWLPWLIVPSALFAVARYVSFRYRYEADELVIRTGIVFRNERHVPYARIQSVDAVQSLLHRWLHVVDVRIQTAGGQEPEATLRVLSTPDYEEMRGRVADMRRRAGAGRSVPEAREDTPSAPIAAAGRTVLALPSRELLLAGFIENRGMVLIAAGIGMLWEFGLVERVSEWLFGEAVAARGAARDLVRDAVRGAIGEGGFPAGRVGLAVLVIAGALVAIRLVSMAWAAVRLHGFRLTRTGDDLRSEFGLLTRISTTIPLHRVQTITVYEGLLHRLAGRAAVRVETAGGETGDVGTTGREWLAPIVTRDALPKLLSEVLPGVDVSTAAWHGPHPRAFRRLLRKQLVAVAIVSAAVAPATGWWALAVASTMGAWTAIASRRRLAYQGWAMVGDTLVFRSGWVSRHLTMARVAKAQVVGLHESPFDRRTGMARVRVDTAGASHQSHRIDIPYLPREAAHTLHDRLAEAAASTAFRW